MDKAQKHTGPKLRFPEFDREWEKLAIGKFIREFRQKSTVQDQYEVLTSARAGLIRQKDYYENERITDRDNIGFNVLPPGYMTYRSRSDDRRFFFNENNLGITGIVSIYYPVFKIVDGDIGFFKNLMSVKEHYIGKFSVGTSQTVLSLKQLSEIRLHFPAPPEQKKIAAFLGAVDEKLKGLQRKRDLLSDYKRGVLQQIFSQHIRFKRDDGSDFPDWEERRLAEVLSEHGLKSIGIEPVFSVSVHKGLVNQIEHLGRSFSAKETDHYNRVLPGDIVYTKSPTGEFPLGIVKQSKLSSDVIVSPLYGVFSPETKWLGTILDAYFASNISMNNYLKPIVQKGAKNTINVTNVGFLSGKLTLPVHYEEQRKIAEFLTALDTKIVAVTAQITQTEAFKKGLLQQMFV